MCIAARNDSNASAPASAPETENPVDRRPLRIAILRVSSVRLYICAPLALGAGWAPVACSPSSPPSPPETAAAPPADPAPVPAIVVGYAAVGIRPARKWYFAGQTPPAVWSERPISTATWTSTAGRTSLAVSATAAVSGGVRTTFARPPTRQGRLTVDGTSHRLAWIPQWTRVTSAKTPEQLRAVVDAPLHPLELLAALDTLTRSQASTERRLQAELVDRAIELGLPTVAVEALTRAGFNAWRRRAFKDAESMLTRARSVEGLEADLLSQARIGLIAGYLHIGTGRYRQAEADIESALVAAERQGNRVLALFLAKARAAALAYQSRYREALALLDEMAPTFQSLPEPLMLPYLVDRAYLRARAMADGAVPPDWVAVQRQMEAALAMARRVERPLTEAEQLVNLVFVAERAGDAAAAQRALGAYRATPAAKDAFGRRMADLLAGRLAVAETPAKAVAIFDRVFETARAEGGGTPSEYAWRAQHGRARALVNLGRFDEALRAFSLAIEELDALSRQTALRRARGQYLDARFGLFDDAVRCALEAGQPARAFLYSERARGLVLRTMVSRSRLEQLSGPAYADWLDAQQRYETARAQLAGRSRLRRRLPRAKRRAFDLETQRLNEVVRKAWDDLDETTESSTPRADPLEDLEALQKALGPEDVVLAFHEIDGATRWFRVDRRGVTAGRETGEADPRSVIGAAGTAFLVPGMGPTTEALVERWTPALIGDMQVSIVPVAAVLAVPLASTDGPPVVVGDPEQDLPQSRREALRVAKHLNTSPLLGPAATREAVTARLSGAAVFHFAGHGDLDAADPWLAMLRLSRGTALRLDDLWVDPVAPGVVVLSGCKTGRPARVGRRLRVMLPAAFLLAGTRAVVATTRDVADRDAARFMSAFYDHRGAERPIAAYRAVARKYLARGEKTWTAFYVGGRGP